MSRRRSAWPILALSILLSLVVAEIILRAVDIPTEESGPPAATAAFLRGPEFGYEVAPHAPLRNEENHEWEKASDEGFRGPDYSVKTPSGTYRIMAIGDSVVQALTVTRPHSWESVLERLLNEKSPEKNPNRRFEVINLGIGGYVSWQILSRFDRRGARYHPDLVLYLGGWNDMLYSSLPDWHPRFHLGEIEAANPPGPNPPAPQKIYRALWSHSHLINLIRHARNEWWNRARIEQLNTERHTHDSGVPFNQAALDNYVANLEKTYRRVKDAGARFGIIVWPTIFTSDLLRDAEIDRRLIVLYSNFPLSTPELLRWHDRYADAQREFLRRHPEVIAVDAAREFDSVRDREARLALFTDMQHLTRTGNVMLASIVLEALTKRDALGHP